MSSWVATASFFSSKKQRCPLSMFNLLAFIRLLFWNEYAKARQGLFIFSASWSQEAVSSLSDCGWSRAVEILQTSVQMSTHLSPLSGHRLSAKFEFALVVLKSDDLAANLLNAERGLLLITLTICSFCCCVLSHVQQLHACLRSARTCTLPLAAASRPCLIWQPLPAHMLLSEG